MAEIALPLLALGGFYIFSNKNANHNKNANAKEKFVNAKENFVNMGSRQNQQQLPNTHVPSENYPKITSVDSTSKNYVRQYLNPNQTTDKFFDGKSNLLNSNTNHNKNINSLSGNQIDNKDFKHNNMVPFFGSKVKGPLIDTDHSQSILDNHQGAGSQGIKKVEQAPLFKPEDNVQWSHGAPNQSEFMLSRELPSTKIANVLPWEQEKVAPGLGLGYTTQGSGGFNSGMLDRPAWAPPTVDELRVKTNPKVTYGLYGHEGPADGKIKKSEVIGTVEKNRQNTDYTVGPDRWFTTTGGALGQTQIPQTILNDNNRLTTTNEYYGASGNDGDSKSSYYKGQYETSTRPELSSDNLTPATAMGQGGATDNDYGVKGYNLLNNNRQTTCNEYNSGVVGGINGAFKAMMAPIVDAIRPSRKENVIGNANQTGNVTALVPNLPITNPGNSVKTTIKETMVDKIGLNYLNVSHLSVPDGGYKNAQIQVKDQERNNGDSSTTGFIGGHDGQMNVSAWDNQRNNVNKTHESWPMPGGTQIFNGSENMQFAKKDDDRVNGRLQTNDCFIQQPRSMADTVPSLDSYGKINMPEQYNQEVNSNRMNPDILTAFKNNPYAQSLNSY